MDWRVRPIDHWPGVPSRAIRSPFSGTWYTTTAILTREFVFLRAKNIVLQLAVHEDDLRLDGWIRSAARIDKPGVILSFDSAHGPLRYACDRFLDWRDNVRAIALGLEALRKIERYGISWRGEQYTGWKALPRSPGEPITDRHEAAEILARHSSVAVVEILSGAPLVVESAFRAAARKTHPDAGGDAVEFLRVTAARACLVGNGTP